ncbi:MAG: tetratricopeptide repeat protein [Beijerinckiaceae bacterium]
MRITDTMQLQALMRSGDWDSVYSMLDDARNRAVTQEDIRQLAYWRSVALTREQRYDEALELLRESADLFNSQSLVQHELACILVTQGRDREALDELKKAPVEEEMEKHYGLAIDAKFFYFYLLAKSGDTSVKERLSEIPDDYRHIAMDGTFLTKTDIVSLLT